MDTETFSDTKKAIRKALADMHESTADEVAGLIVVSAKFVADEPDMLSANLLVAGNPQTVATMVRNMIKDIVTQRPDVGAILLMDAVSSMDTDTLNSKDMH